MKTDTILVTIGNSKLMFLFWQIHMEPGIFSILMKKETTKSSGNVFIDLGFDPAEAAVLQMRASLMSDLRLYIENNKLTQAEAAKRLGIAQSRVSDLVRGKWEKFSLEMLITLEARLGRSVRIELAA